MDVNISQEPTYINFESGMVNTASVCDRTKKGSQQSVGRIEHSTHSVKPALLGTECDIQTLKSGVTSDTQSLSPDVITSEFDIQSLNSDVTITAYNIQTNFKAGVSGDIQSILTTECDIHNSNSGVISTECDMQSLTPGVSGTDCDIQSLKVDMSGDNGNLKPGVISTEFDIQNLKPDEANPVCYVDSNCLYTIENTDLYRVIIHNAPGNMVSSNTSVTEFTLNNAVTSELISDDTKLTMLDNEVGYMGTDFIVVENMQDNTTDSNMTCELNRENDSSDVTSCDRSLGEQENKADCGSKQQSKTDCVGDLENKTDSVTLETEAECSDNVKMDIPSSVEKTVAEVVIGNKRRRRQPSRYRESENSDQHTSAKLSQENKEENVVVNQRKRGRPRKNILLEETDHKKNTSPVAKKRKRNCQTDSVCESVEDQSNQSGVHSPNITTSTRSRRMVRKPEKYRDQTQHQTKNASSRLTPAALKRAEEKKKQEELLNDYKLEKCHLCSLSFPRRILANHLKTHHAKNISIIKPVPETVKEDNKFDVREPSPLKQKKVEREELSAPSPNSCERTVDGLVGEDESDEETEQNSTAVDQTDAEPDYVPSPPSPSHNHDSEDDMFPPKKQIRKKKYKKFTKETEPKTDKPVLSEDNPFKCDQCPATYRTIKTFKLHYSSHFETGKPPESSQVDYRPFKCDKCTAAYTEERSLIVHTRKHTGEKPFMCDLCPMAFRDASGLTKHRRKHTGEKPFVCHMCAKAFEVSSALLQHMRTHSTERPHKCDQCPAAFLIKSALRVHMNVHTEERPYKCHICPKAFKDMRSLTKHLHRHSKTESCEFKCEACGASHASKNDLKEHILQHHNDMSFKCKMCYMTFTSKRNALRHEKSHSARKVHQCDLCPLAFSVPYALTAHKRTHTGEKPYVCKVCQVGFATSSSRTQHMRIHTGEKPYSCDVCLIKFSQLSAMKAHKMTHTDERPAKCKLCPSAFRRPVQMRRHMENVHGVSYS